MENVDLFLHHRCLFLVRFGAEHVVEVHVVHFSIEDGHQLALAVVTAEAKAQGTEATVGIVKIRSFQLLE